MTGKVPRRIPKRNRLVPKCPNGHGAFAGRNTKGRPKAALNVEAGGPPGPPASELRALLVVSVPFLAQSTKAATTYRLTGVPSVCGALEQYGPDVSRGE